MYRILLQVLQFPSNGVTTVTSPLSQMSCKVVMAVKTIGVISQILTIIVHSNLSLLRHERTIVNGTWHCARDNELTKSSSQPEEV